jgi:hypothetical protein
MFRYFIRTLLTNVKVQHFSIPQKVFQEKISPNHEPLSGYFTTLIGNHAAGTRLKKAICQQYIIFLCLFHRKAIILVPTSRLKEKVELRGRKRRFPSRKTMYYA